MYWIVVLLPGVLAVGMSDKLKKERSQQWGWITRYGIYTFLTNLCAMCMFEYVFPIEEPFQNAFLDNTFVLHYGMVMLFYAILLPVVRVALKPQIAVHKKTEQA